MREKILEHLRHLEGFPSHIQLQCCSPKPALPLESEIVSTSSGIISYCFLSAKDEGNGKLPQRDRL